VIGVAGAARAGRAERGVELVITVGHVELLAVGGDKPGLGTGALRGLRVGAFLGELAEL